MLREKHGRARLALLSYAAAFLLSSIFLLALRSPAAEAPQSGKAAAPGKVESIAELSRPGISAAMSAALEKSGYRLYLPDGTALCELWLRGSPHAAGKQGASGSVYPSLTVSTLIGVIAFPQAASDFRGQRVKAGMYAMRFGLIPNDGNHLGVAPSRDFLLLLPLAADQDPDAVYSMDELIRLSVQGSETPHPLPMALVQPPEGPTPSLSLTTEGWYVFSAKFKSGMSLALVVKGSAAE